MTRAEFYIGDDDKFIAIVREAGAVPREGDLINIEKVTYKVIRVTWAVDHAASTVAAGLRANVVLEPVNQQGQEKP